jgi:septal ring factor EnvC (AmiA/AmiB activator)
MLNKIFYIIGGFFLVIAISAAVGLGVWAYNLNIQLTQARTDYQTLKSGNEKLNNAYNDLTTESSKTQTDLAAAQAQIENLQGQLKKAQEDNDSLNARITAIQGKVSILYTSEFGTETTIDAKINASGDDQLKQLWTAWKNTRSRDDNIKFRDYIIQSIANTAGLSLSPNLVLNGALIGLVV